MNSFRRSFFHSRLMTGYQKRVKFFTAIFGLAVLLCSSSAHSGQYAVLLSEKDFIAGSEVPFSLVFLQQSPNEQVIFPTELVGHVTTADGQSREILAKSRNVVEFQDNSAVKAYFEQQFSIRLPRSMHGQVILSFRTVDVPSLVFNVNESVTQEDVALEKSYPTLDSLFTLYQPYAKNASAYEPMYFLAGAELSKSKFQVSFKYRFINPDTALADDLPWITGLHFGYTQTSYWDLESDSAPFSDSSYKPELFWLSDNFMSSSPGILKGVFFQGGVQHESNGRGGDLSRSTNYLYARPVFVFYDHQTSVGLQLAPKFWAYINNDDNTNPDLMDYRGYFEIEAKGGLADSLVLGSTFRWAEEGASIQLDLSYPLHRFFNGALDIYLYAQYTNMLAEGLQDYTERSEAFRLGLAIVR